MNNRSFPTRLQPRLAAFLHVLLTTSESGLDKSHTTSVTSFVCEKLGVGCTVCQGGSLKWAVVFEKLDFLFMVSVTEKSCVDSGVTFRPEYVVLSYVVM